MHFLPASIVFHSWAGKWIKENCKIFLLKKNRGKYVERNVKSYRNFDNERHRN